MPETTNQSLVKPFTPLEKPKKQPYLIKNEILKITIYLETYLPFHLKGFVECWRIPIGANLVSLAVGATIDHFAHRSNQVGFHPLPFQLHVFKLSFNASFI
jgi:hypothetical protein